MAEIQRFHAGELGKLGGLSAGAVPETGGVGGFVGGKGGFVHQRVGIGAKIGKGSLKTGVAKQYHFAPFARRMDKIFAVQGVAIGQRYRFAAFERAV